METNVVARRQQHDEDSNDVSMPRNVVRAVHLEAIQQFAVPNDSVAGRATRVSNLTMQLVDQLLPIIALHTPSHTPHPIRNLTAPLAGWFIHLNSDSAHA